MTVPETNEKRGFVWPADYYSSATPAPAVPSALTYGCGAASLLVLLVIFAGGAFVSGSGLSSFMDMALGMSLGEMRGMYAAEVTPARKQSLEAEVEKMREGLRGGKVSIVALQPFMQNLQGAITDRKVTAQEAALLEESARKISASAKR
ncbi:MAG TPA: hypothetical protein VE974_29415 [Thermoanaerobaculia bacterium]|nr:hypothetical protein [Thermoanaerobaculia bacterium]